MVFKKILVSLALCGSQLSFSQVVALVNGKEITAEMIREALLGLGQHGRLVAERPELRERFIEHYIQTELSAEAAVKGNIKEGQEFKNRLAQAEKHILASMYTEQWLNEKTSTKALKEYFDTHKEIFHRRQVKLVQLCLTDKKEAEKILAQIRKKPELFEDLSKKNEFRCNSPEGGVVDWFEKGSQELAIEQAAFNTSVGKVCPHLVASHTGFHIIKVLDIRSHDDLSFENLSDTVKKFRVRELREEYAKELKANAKIVVHPERLMYLSSQ